ncbi:hypothetical protein DPMN_174786 [Dreissena polymorpha]|uniref:Uncharacterized protein n=1 Tax=Dreissena polymorpha TaxID=45954 RepID=A0A9D4E6M3_DREPO|nr:hypothetical protein DPMN_174786 [Dreissena polymorpha]
MREELQKRMESINGMMDIVKNSNERLTDIALRPRPTNEAELNKHIIGHEQFTKIIGYQGRVGALSTRLGRTGIADTAKQLTDEFQTVGIKENEKDIFLKGLQGIYKIFGMNIP